MLTAICSFAFFVNMNGQIAPVISDIPDQTIAEGATFAEIMLNELVYDEDTPDEELNWQIENTPNLYVQISDTTALVTVSDENWNGSEIITFIVDDGISSDTDDATFTITPVNDAPIVNDIPDFPIVKGETFAPVLLDDYVTDIDNNKSELTWDYDGNEELSVNIDELHYAYVVEPEDFTGSETISFSVSDGLAEDDDLSTFTVSRLNPVAKDDQYVVDEGATLSTPASGVLSNDLNADDESTTAIAVTGPVNGSTFNLNGDGSFVYTHNGSETTSDAFTYLIDDGVAQSNVAIVTIEVLPVNDAPVITGLTGQVVREGNDFTDIDLNTLVDDAEDTDDLLAWEATGTTSLNILINEETNIASITPPNKHWNGSETITFTVTDTEDLSDSESATFEVTALAEAPFADDDEYDVGEGGILIVAAPGVLDGDTDGDGDPLLAVLESSPAHSTSFNLDPSGAFTYTHDGSETTEDAFTYQASDGSLESNTATVTINIELANEAPTLNDISGEWIAFNEGNPAVSFLSGLIVNDPENALSAATITISQNYQSDADVLDVVNNMGLTVTPLGNQLTLTGPASVANYQSALRSATFRNTSEDPSTLDRTMQISVYDGTEYSNMLSKTLHVTAQNDPLVVSDIPNQTRQEGNTFSTINLDDYVIDPDNADNEITWSHYGQSSLTVSIVSRVATITTPNTDWFGSETITFAATDPMNEYDSDPATFTVTAVNDAPVATGDAFSVAEGGTFSQAAPGVLSNDTDPEGSTLTASKVSDPANGTLTLNANGSFIYIHNGTETTTDAFAYRAYDGVDYSNTVTVNITITPVNDPPVATGDAYSIAEGGTLNQAAPGVLSNDTDPEGTTLTASKVSDPTNGTLTLNANGSFIYIHNGTETTTDAFTYRAYDGVNYSNTVTVNMTITAVNDPPVATGDAFSVAEGGTFNQAAPGVLSNDTDPEGSTLTASKVSDPANGTLTLNANGSFIYIHNGTETTTDAFTYRAYDGVSYSNTVTVNITITNVNDPPVASALVIGGANNSIGTEQIASFAFTDPDGDGPGTHTYQWYRSNNSNGVPATAISGATSDTYVPVLADGGKFIGFEVTPRDIHGLVGTLVRIPIFKPINAAPVASNVHVDAPGTLPGQVLTALLSYADAESDPAGVHTFNWYRANSTPTPAAPGIPVGTESTYTLKAADAGKYIWFRVSPVATTGSTPGEFVWSNNIIGPIGNFSANIAGSGTFCQGSTMNITLTITGGKSPYTAKLHRSGSISDQDTTIYNIAASPYTIQVKISGSYELKSLTDASTPTPDVAVVSSTPVILTINPKAKALLSGTYEICNDGVKQAQIPMNFTSGVSPWSVKLKRGISQANDTTILGITQDPFTFNARVIGAAPTQYRIIEIRDANGCLGDTTSGSAWVSYKPSPSATISGLDSICPGTVDSLIVELNSGTMPWSYTYLRDGSNQVTVANINTTKVKLYVNNPGIYTLTAVSDQVCTGKVSGTGTIRSYEVPTATITGTQTICQHTSGNLNVALTGHQPWRYKYRLVGVDTTELIGVTASPNVTTTKRAGTYNLLEVYDKNCKGSVFGSATISFIPAPEVELTGLAPAYDKQYNQLVPLTGTPTGTPGNSQFSGPGLILNDGKYSFFPPLANVGTNNIVYSYRATSSSCWGYDTSVVRILEANSIIEFENDRTKYCTNDQPFTIIGTNILGVTGGFSISGGIGLTDHGNNTATITPALLNPNNYTITYTYYDAGLPQPKQASFDVGVSPVADFKGATECYQSGQSVTLNNTSVSNFGFLSDTLFFWKILNKTGSGYVVNDTAENISYTFAEPGNYNISLELYNSYGCYANTSRTFTLRPTIKPAEETQFEEFETGALGWTKGSSSDSPNSWTLGDPDRGFTGPFSGENCWFTLTQGTRPPKEQSWVTTPCYDFRGTEKPMLKMWVWRLFNSNRDGANVQFSADSGKTWTPLGDLNDGISWYNYTYIPGLIGDNKIGWCVHPVTNLGNDTEWKEVRHSLDILKDKPQVQFRIAYGSDGSAQNNNGIAFDNFWIGERRRTAIIEHFTNSSDADCMEADSVLDAFTEDNELSVINIQYHTSNPSGDPFFEDNSVIPSTREFYYGVSDVPYALLNGGVTGQHSFDYQEGSKPLDKNAAIIESLREASFDISISSAYNGNILDVEVDIVAAKVMPMTELSVRVAVIEREIHGINGNNGDTVFRNVVKAMLPGAAGVSINKSWSVSDHQKIDLEWPVQQVYDPQQLRLVAFVQDEATYEIYQVVLDTIDGESGIFDPRPEKPLKKNFIVYPNPASQSAFVRFENELTNSTFINLYNNTGSLVYSNRIEAGNNMAEIPVADLPDGIYMLRMTVKNQLLGTSKLIISR